jgi:hypothetical protein
MRRISSLLAVTALSGCFPSYPNRFASSGVHSGYPASPTIPTTSSSPAGPAAPAAAAQTPALGLPARPGPFGALEKVKLGQTRADVAAVSQKLAEGRLDERDTTYKVEFDRDRLTSMQITFLDRSPAAELEARWGAPKSAGTRFVWLAAEDELHVILDEAQRSVHIARYVPVMKLVRADGNKLAGLAADVLAMDRKAFEARFPEAKLEKSGTDVILEVTLPPIEGTLAKSTMEARFASSGTFVSLELTLRTLATAEVDTALRTVYGAPRELPLCPPAKKPCLIASGVYQSDPVLRYGKSGLEVTTWPHDFAQLTIRWSRAATRTDFFTTMTRPDRVKDTEQDL